MAKHNDKQQRLVNDAAKSLLANIRFMSIDNPIRSIVITSTIPNEGKSFVAINLAQAIASSGKTCLIVEADLRKRTLAAAMGIHPEHGIYTVLSGSDLKDVAVATPQRNLYFLDAEPQIPNPPDLLSSRRYIRFLETAVNSFDYVVIDTPPVGTFVDAAVIANHADATFLVVRENFTKKEFVKSAYDQLEKAGANVAGVVMNACDMGSDDYYGYYSYYSYYDEDGGKGKNRSGTQHVETIRESAGSMEAPAPVAQPRAKHSDVRRPAQAQPSSQGGVRATSTVLNEAKRTGVTGSFEPVRAGQPAQGVSGRVRDQRPASSMSPAAQQPAASNASQGKKGAHYKKRPTQQPAAKEDNLGYNSEDIADIVVNAQAERKKYARDQYRSRTDRSK